MNQNELRNNIKLFFQTLYNKHTGRDLNFEARILTHSYGVQILQIVSPVLNENETQQRLHDIEQYNAYLKRSYPGLEINITPWDKGQMSLVFISSFTYENYYSLMHPSLRTLVVNFFKKYDRVKNHLTEDLKEDIESSLQLN